MDCVSMCVRSCVLLQVEEEEKLRLEFAKQGIIVPKVERSSIFDSNIITPGTGFMHRLSSALQYYIHQRLNTEPAWKSVKVILSDANVPGEGEHKIMNFIRLQRGQPGWNPNTKHVMYGLDADLIMLGLATHEAHFHILREVVFMNNRQKDSKDDGNGEGENKFDVYAKPFQFVDISIVRECIEMEMRPASRAAQANGDTVSLDRMIDDYVFMCFFVGNDFLPHVPTLDIREGAIDLLMQIYREEFRKIGGYLTDGSTINTARVEKFLSIIAASEDAIFRKRLNKNIRDRHRRNRMAKEKGQEMQRQRNTLLALQEAGLAPSAATTPGPGDQSNKLAAVELKKNLMAAARDGGTSNERSSDSMKRKLNGDGDDASKKAKVGDSGGVGAAEYWAQLEKTGGANAEEGANGAATGVLASDSQVQKFSQTISVTLREKSDLTDDAKHVDSVRLGEPGWKERYYETKFGAKSQDARSTIASDVVHRYLEGLSWVMRYYYDGVASWEWYYPYHYAPFASDFRNLESYKIEFDLGQPFRPFDQLMGVLPAASGHCLPEAYANLMTDKDSPIIDFYPEDFDLDLNGKRFAWQAVVLLPFIDQKRLLDATSAVMPLLNDEEKRRNSNLTNLMFVHTSHPLSKQMLDTKGGDPAKNPTDTKINPVLSDAMNGFLRRPGGDVCPAHIESPLPASPDIDINNVACNIYVDPPYHKHQCRLLPGARPATANISDVDISIPRYLWHEDGGGGPRQQGGAAPGGFGGGPVTGAMLSQAAHRLLDRSLVSNFDVAGRSVGGAAVGNHQYNNPAYNVYRQFNGAAYPPAPYPAPPHPAQQQQQPYMQAPMGGYPQQSYGPNTAYGGNAPYPMQMPPPPPAYSAPIVPYQQQQQQQQQQQPGGYNPFSALVRQQPPHPSSQQQQQRPHGKHQSNQWRRQ